MTCDEPAKPSTYAFAEQAIYHKRFRTASTTLLLALALALPASGAGNAETTKPFATIGPALVKGDYHQYPPFYGTVIAPHAVVAKDEVFCAFQDTKGRPVVMAYDIRAKAGAGPVHASQFRLGYATGPNGPARLP